MPRIREKHLKPNEITDLLDSDNELPDSYEDVPFKPAYEDDCRFEPIRFPWVDQQLQKLSEQNNEKFSNDQQSEFSLESDYDDSNYESSDSYSGIDTPSKPKEKRILISKGVLTRRDIFLIKSIEKFATDTTLLWFIDFLKYKSMEPKKMSCLVENIFDNQCTDSTPSLSNLRRYQFIIKTW